MTEQAGTTDPRRNEPGRDAQPKPARIGRPDLHRRDDGMAVRTDVVEQKVGRREQALDRTPHADPRGRALLRRGLRVGRPDGLWQSVQLGPARAAQVGPDHDALDVHPDRDAHAVVLPQPAVPERSAAPLAQMTLGVLADLLTLGRRRVLDRLGSTLDEDVLGPR